MQSTLMPGVAPLGNAPATGCCVASWALAWLMGIAISVIEVIISATMSVADSLVLLNFVCILFFSFKIIQSLMMGFVKPLFAPRVLIRFF